MQTYCALEKQLNLDALTASLRSDCKRLDNGSSTQQAPATWLQPAADRERQRAALGLGNCRTVSCELSFSGKCAGSARCLVCACRVG